MKAIIIQKGTKLLRSAYIQRVIESLDDAKEYLVEIKQCVSVRRIAQNKLMWMWHQQQVEWYRKHYGLSKPPEFFKYYYQALYLGYEFVETSGEPITRLKGTSKLSIKDFAKYLENIKLDIESDEDYQGMMLKDPELYRYAVHGEKRAA